MDASSIHIPVIYKDNLIGYRDSLKIWLFSNQSFEPSYWLILKREGFSGLAYAPVEELDIFVLSLSTEQLVDIYRLHFGSTPTAPNFLDLRLSVHHLLQNNLIRVFYMEDPDGTHESRFADANDVYYAMPEAFAQHSTSFYRNQLAETMGKHIASRWLGKEKADGEHFSRPWIIRQIIEDGDAGQAIVNTGWDFIKGLWDIGCLVFSVAGGVLVLQLKIQQQAFKSLADLSTGDLEAIEKDLQALGLFVDQKLASAQQLKDTIEKGYEILQLLIDDPHTHQLFSDFFDSLYESTPYRQSRTMIVRVLAEIGLEVVIALATLGIGNAARRVGQLAANADHAADLAKGSKAIGPFTRGSLAIMTDLARSLKAERSVTVSGAPPPTVPIPEYARQKGGGGKKPKKKGLLEKPRDLNDPAVRKALLTHYGVEVGTYRDLKKIDKPGFQREHFLPHSNFMERSSLPNESRGKVPIREEFGNYTEDDAITYFVYDAQKQGTEHRYLTDVEVSFAKDLEAKGEYATVNQWLDHMEVETAKSLPMDTIERADGAFVGRISNDDAGDVARAIRLEYEAQLDIMGVDKTAQMSNLVGRGSVPPRNVTNVDLDF